MARWGPKCMVVGHVDGPWFCYWVSLSMSLILGIFNRLCSHIFDVLGQVSGWILSSLLQFLERGLDCSLQLFGNQYIHTSMGEKGVDLYLYLSICYN